MKNIIALFLAVVAVVTARQNTSLQSHTLSVAIPTPVAFLKHADDVCNCAFKDTCSCEGALEFMKCIRAGCDSGICQCMAKDGDNHFEQACQEMSEGCPGIGMECGAEQATCGGDTVAWSGDEGAKEASLDDEDLPPGWEALWSKDYERVYYSNTKTGEVTWTKPKNQPAQKKQPAQAVEKKKAHFVPKHHYKRKVTFLHSHVHHMFAKGTITTILVLCLTSCLAQSSNTMIRTNTWSTIDAVITTFMSLAWYYVIMHYLDFAGYKGVEKLAIHLGIATLLLLASSMITWFMQMQASKDKNADIAESTGIFNSIFTPIVMWSNAGAVSTAQQLAKPSEMYVLLMTGAMVGFYALLAVFWYYVVGSMTRRDWSEGTITTLTGASLAAGFVLWVHMILVGSYQTVEDPHPTAPGMDKTLVLNCFGLLYIALACVVATPLKKVIDNTDKAKDYVKWRTLSVVATFLSILPYFSCVLSLGHLILDNLGYDGGAIEARLYLAVISSLIGMFLIVLVAKVERLREDTTLSGCLIGLGGFMAGTAWANLLNNSINMMAHGYTHPFKLKFMVTCFLTAIVFPVYFYYFKPLVDAKMASKSVSS
jgi:hypothetical protein